jgi:hypothetical protein
LLFFREPVRRLSPSGDAWIRLEADSPTQARDRLDSLATFARHPVQASATRPAPSAIAINERSQVDYWRFE